MLTSDWHLSHQRPSARADDWYAVQAGYFQQLVDLLPSWEVPIIVAGDLVDKWSQPSEWTNWAFKHVPECWAVCGQHDLPLHNADDLHKSAFQTLVEMGRVQLLGGVPRTFSSQFGVNLRVYGFGWNEPILPPMPKEKGFNFIDLAVIHKYIWASRDDCYPGANKESQLKRWLYKLGGYDVVLIGDNHRQWKKGSVLNPGTFIRRKADEIDHQPCVGLLFPDGTIKRHYLDVSGDRFVDRPEKAASKEMDLSAFVAGLTKLGKSGLDFPAAVRKALESKRINKETRELILKAME